MVESGNNEEEWIEYQLESGKESGIILKRIGEEIIHHSFIQNVYRVPGYVPVAGEKMVTRTRPGP